MNLSITVTKLDNKSTGRHPPKHKGHISEINWIALFKKLSDFVNDTIHNFPFLESLSWNIVNNSFTKKEWLLKTL